MKIQTLCLALSEFTKQGICENKPGVYTFDLSEVQPNAVSFISRTIVDTDRHDSEHAALALANPQLLGYVLVHSRNKGLLRYTRPDIADGESRLKGLHSLGFGGHVDISDIITKPSGVLDLDATMRLNISRELHEELNIRDSWSYNSPRLKFQGFAISDPRPNPTDEKLIAVGQAHRGIILTLDITDLEHYVKSSSETQGLTWISADEALEDLGNYESWSQLLITDFITTGAVN